MTKLLLLSFVFSLSKAMKGELEFKTSVGNSDFGTKTKTKGTFNSVVATGNEMSFKSLYDNS